MPNNALQLLPAFSLDELSSGSLHAQSDRLKQLGTAIEEYGAFFITDAHNTLAANAAFTTAAKQFFVLSDTMKQKYEHPERFGERGYIGREKEHVAPDTPGDLKEFYSIGKDVPPYDACEEFFFPNIWPTEVPHFQEAGTALYNHLEKISQKVLQYVGEYFELPQNFFEKKIRNSNHTLLRSIYYYPLEKGEYEPDARRTAEHTDINLLTLLLQKDRTGFEFFLDGTWHAAPTNGSILVFFGDMFERFTNSRVSAVRHRVQNPERLDENSQSSLVTTFYVHPHEHVDLVPFDSCVDDTNPKKFEDVSAGALFDDRLRELGLKF